MFNDLLQDEDVGISESVQSGLYASTYLSVFIYFLQHEHAIFRIIFVVYFRLVLCCWLNSHICCIFPIGVVLLVEQLFVQV
jgi:hypothetical protein